MSTPLLSVENLAVAYKEADRYARVTHDVSFTVEPGEVVALVGESGSGKTTTAQAVIGLLPDNGRIDHGAIRLNGEDISRWTGKRFDAIRGRQISLIQLAEPGEDGWRAGRRNRPHPRRRRRQGDRGAGD